MPLPLKFNGMHECVIRVFRYVDRRTIKIIQYQYQRVKKKILSCSSCNSKRRKDQEIIVVKAGCAYGLMQEHKDQTLAIPKCDHQTSENDRDHGHQFDQNVQ